MEKRIRVSASTSYLDFDMGSKTRGVFCKEA